MNSFSILPCVSKKKKNKRDDTPYPWYRSIFIFVTHEMLKSFIGFDKWESSFQKFESMQFDEQRVKSKIFDSFKHTIDRQ